MKPRRPIQNMGSFTHDLNPKNTPAPGSSLQRRLAKYRDQLEALRHPGHARTRLQGGMTVMPVFDIYITIPVRGPISDDALDAVFTFLADDPSILDPAVGADEEKVTLACGVEDTMHLTAEVRAREALTAALKGQVRTAA